MGADPMGEDVYQAGYVVGFSYGYILGLAYGVEAFVDPTTANTLTAEGFTTASDVGFGATAYSALSSDSLSTSSTIGLAAYFAKLILAANANAAATAEAYGEAFGTNAESVSMGGPPTAGVPPPGPVSKNWHGYLQERGISLPVAPTGLSPSVPSTPTAPAIPY
jgi:hypothetical protein